MFYKCISIKLGQNQIYYYRKIFFALATQWYGIIGYMYVWAILGHIIHSHLITGDLEFRAQISRVFTSLPQDKKEKKENTKLGREYFIISDLTYIRQGFQSLWSMLWFWTPFAVEHITTHTFYAYINKNPSWLVITSLSSRNKHERMFFRIILKHKKRPIKNPYTE